MDMLLKAKALAERVEAEAAKAKAPVAVCIIDVHGNLVLQHRMNGAPLFSLEISERKAYTSALVGVRTADLLGLCQPGQSLYALPTVGGGRFCPMGAAPLQLAGRQGDHFARRVIEIDQFDGRRGLGEHRSQALDDIRGAVGVPDRPPRRFGGAVQIGRVGSQHPHAGAGVGQDSGQRLAHLVGDRGGHGIEGRDPGHMGELASRPREAFLSEAAFGDVLKRAHEYGTSQVKLPVRLNLCASAR
jgi:uncharacterized protein GlcG (DUF336 family)